MNEPRPHQNKNFFKFNIIYIYIYNKKQREPMDCMSIVKLKSCEFFFPFSLLLAFLGLEREIINFLVKKMCNILLFNPFN